MEEKADSFEHLKLLYSENATLFRFYLTWRQVLFAGYFAILAALALSFRWALGQAQSISFVFPFAAAGISVLFWALDYRNRQLYRLAASVGSAIEEKLSPPQFGYFAKYEKTKHWMTHGTALSVFYFGCGLLHVLAGVIAATTPSRLVPAAG